MEWYYIVTGGKHLILILEATEMKKGNVYENKMGSVLRVTAIKNDMVYVTYNGKKKAPVAKAEFERWIKEDIVVEV